MICPVHRSPSVLRPAGVSKTKFNPDGTPKSYGAFWVCSIPACREKQVEEGTMTTTGPVRATPPPATPSPNQLKRSDIVLRPEFDGLVQRVERLENPPLSPKVDDEINVEDIPF